MDLTCLQKVYIQKIGGDRKTLQIGSEIVKINNSIIHFSNFDILTTDLHNLMIAELQS